MQPAFVTTTTGSSAALARAPEVLSVERVGPSVVWTINRPDARNALDYATLRALGDAVAEAATEREVRAAVLTGAGDVFASGGDLRELRDKTSRLDAEQFSELGWEITCGIAALPIPVVCALQGPAIGGGAELALACDMRVADERASLSFKQVKMGVTTAWGTVPRLVSLVGAGTAARLLYAAHEVSARQALEMGLVDEVTKTGSSRLTALAWADDIAAGAPLAVAEMKRLLRAATAASAAQRSLERACFADRWSSPDHVDAVEAYFERRIPRWHAR